MVSLRKDKIANGKICLKRKIFKKNIGRALNTNLIL